jgi:hypothetical protein
MGHRVRQLLEIYASRGIRFYAPDVAFADAEKYLPPLLVKRGKLPDSVCAIWTEDSDFFGTGIARLDHKPHRDFSPSSNEGHRIRRRVMPTKKLDSH